jgi:hypothetical protein
MLRNFPGISINSSNIHFPVSGIPSISGNRKLRKGQKTAKKKDPGLSARIFNSFYIPDLFRLHRARSVRITA